MNEKDSKDKDFKRRYSIFFNSNVRKDVLEFAELQDRFSEVIAYLIEKEIDENGVQKLFADKPARKVARKKTTTSKEKVTKEKNANTEENIKEIPKKEDIVKVEKVTKINKIDKENLKDKSKKKKGKKKKKK